MQTVEPIRDPKKIMAIKILLRDNEPRNYLLFTLGMNLALRVSDLLSLKIKDVLDKRGEVVDYLFLREKKTKREKRIKLNKVAKEALEYYFSKETRTDPEGLLFISKRSGSRLDREFVWRLIKRWAEAVGLKGRFGTHTLRKTWGYMARKQGFPIEKIQHKLGHKSPEVTRRYIGITQDEINEIEDKICL